MKRRILSIGVILLTGGVAYSQVGINTEDPKATLDVMSVNTGSTTAEGFIAPRLTRTQVIGKDTQYALPQTGTIVYITDLSGSTTTKTAKIIQIGYYYFDGTLWQPFTSAAATNSNPWNKVGTALPSTLNTDNSYLTAKTVIGGSVIASINGTAASAQLTVTGGDASINGLTVGKGRSTYDVAENTAVGISSLSRNTLGVSLTALGYNTLSANTTGANNTAVGTYALETSNTGSDNTAIGAYSLSTNTTGTKNTAIGHTSLEGNSSGIENTAIGYQALLSSTTASQNTAVGAQALGLNTTGEQNVAIGSYGLWENRTGSRNVGIGRTAAQYLQSGNDNILIGFNAARNLTTGSSNLTIGSNTDLPSGTGSNQMNIANTIYGTTSITSAGGRVSIGKTAPAAGVTLDVAGLTQITGVNTFRYVDGNQAAGKVLASDASGNAEWKDQNMLSGNWFYIPSINLDMSSLTAKTVDLFKTSVMQLAVGPLAGSPGYIKPTVPITATEYDYLFIGSSGHITNVSIDANGIMTYTPTTTNPPPFAYVNIIVRVK